MSDTKSNPSLSTSTATASSFGKPSPPDNLTFICAPVFTYNVALEGMMQRVLIEINKRRKINKDLTTGKPKPTTNPGYFFTQPSVIFSAGSEITSYVFEQTNWNTNIVDYYVNNLPHNFIITKYWWGRKYLGYLKALYEGALYDWGAGADNLIEADKTRPYLLLAAKNGREHIVPVTENVTSQTLAVTNMSKDDPRSIFYLSNNDPKIGSNNAPVSQGGQDTYLYDQLNTIVSYAKTLDDFKGDQVAYNEYIYQRDLFALKASSAVPLLVKPVKPSAIIDDGVIKSENYYSSLGVTTQTSYEALIDLVSSTRKIAKLFLFTNDDLPVENDVNSKNIVSNGLYVFKQVVDLYREQRFIRNVVSDNGAYFFNKHEELYKITGTDIIDMNDINLDPKSTLTNLIPRIPTIDNVFQEIADLLDTQENSTDLNNVYSQAFAIIFRYTGTMTIPLQGYSNQTFIDTFNDGFNNFSVNIIKRGILKDPTNP
jgi:hypothetical protein